jgi:uncharacterized membrane protein YeaQ/YmgE (transglycosylase-associated protein family)
MDTTSLIIDLISGAVGGNAAGAAMPDKSLGTLGNTIAGLVGGGLGGQILQALVPALSGSGSSDLGGILANIAGSGVGGGLLMAIISVIKNALAEKA